MKTKRSTSQLGRLTDGKRADVELCMIYGESIDFVVVTEEVTIDFCNEV